MTYGVLSRYEVRGELVLMSPVSIGGWDDDGGNTLRVVRNNDGTAVIPGTSLAGALRSWYFRYLRGRGDSDKQAKAATNHVFGFIGPSRSQEGSISWIRIADAVPVGPSPAFQTRDSVTIDPRTGSAHAGLLFSRETVAAGTRFAFTISGDQPSRNEPSDMAEHVRLLIAALADGQISLGAAKTTGLGRCRAVNLKHRTLEIGNREGLLAFLTGKVAYQPLNAADLPTPGSNSRLTIEIDWQPVQPLIVKSSLQGSAISTLPLTTRIGAVNPLGKADPERVHLLLPGSSVKGVLRAHAEKIIRTLKSKDVPDDLADERSDPQALPGVPGLFGLAPGTKDDSSTTGWQGALSTADCLSQGHLSGRDWDSIVEYSLQKNPETSIQQTIGPITLSDDQQQNVPAGRFRVTHHVAIDRWTGGASEGRLFSVMEPVGVRWRALTLEVDTLRIATEPGTTKDSVIDETLSFVLLLLVLRDLALGEIMFGSGSTRGYGQITVTDIRFGVSDVRGPWACLAGRTLAEILQDPPEQVTEALEQWNAQMPSPA